MSHTDVLVITVVEEANDPPSAVLYTNKITVEAGSNIYFNGSESTDSDGSIVEYTWDFGDGTRDSGMHSSHIFESEGTYYASLTVIDDDGDTDTTGISITVTEAVTETTPTGALDFTESTQTTGLYTGSFVSLSKSAQINDTTLTITDDSLGNSVSQYPIVPGTVLQVPGGLNCTYYDNNQNWKIDGGDTIRAHNADSGDIIKFSYIPTGGVIAQYTFV